MKSIGCACAYEDVSDEKKFPAMAMYGSLARPPGGPPSDCLADGTDEYPETFHPRSLLEKRSLVGFPIRNRHRKAPREAMLVKMAGFP